MQAATRFEHFLTLATGGLVRTGSIKAVVRTEEVDAADRTVACSNTGNRSSPFRQRELLLMPAYLDFNNESWPDEIILPARDSQSPRIAIPYPRPHQKIDEELRQRDCHGAHFVM